MKNLPILKAKKLHSRIIGTLNKFLSAQLSQTGYLKFSKFIYPLFYLRPPCWSVHFQIVSPQLLIVKDLEGEHFFFSHRRATRYTLRQKNGKSGGFSGCSDWLAGIYHVSNLVIEPHHVVVEVGANIGELTSYFLKSTENVFCFEIDPLALSCLERNCPKASIIEKAASDKTGESTLYLASEGASSSLIPSHTNEISKEARQISTQRLDEFMENESIKKVRLLKIEAEGAEPEVLMGLGERIHDVDYIAIDAGPERYGNTTLSEVVNILRREEFRFRKTRFHVLGINPKLQPKG